MLRNKTFAPSYQTGLIRGSKLQGKSVARVRFRSKLPRVYWNLVSVKWRVSSWVVSSFSSLVVSFVCWGTYPGACCRSVLLEQAPSCVPALTPLGLSTWAKSTSQLGFHFLRFKLISYCRNKSCHINFFRKKSVLLRFCACTLIRL